LGGKRLSAVRILYRDREARVDLREESRTELEPDERVVLQAFEHALPNPPERIPLGSDGVAEYVLLETGIWTYDGDGIRFAEYTLAIRGGESPLPWPVP
jgi:hypothetical protein